ncbi:hypothetical protein G6F22_014079 [Rhizopus arrhizus]|nr:hypothetical protein G6F22_014079 [Rhizopus arrhizus]
MDDGQLAQRLGGGGQRRDQVAVELDHRQLRMHAQQRQRDRALARTDFDQAVAVFRIDRHHDLVDVVAIGQEMLAKLLLGRGGEHRAGGGMRGIHALSAGGIGDAAAGQVQRGAMVDRHARVGQAQGQVHCLFEARVLQHRQALVVVHRQHGVEAGQLGRQEGGVGRQRPDQVHAFSAQALQQRDDQVQFLAAQVAVFTGVRVQAEHGDARRRQAELAAQRGMHGTQGVFQAGCGDRIGHLAQRQVGGGQGHAHDGVGQHHHHLHPGLVGQQFGGAAVGDAAFVDDRLVHRAGDHALQFAAEAGSARALKRVDDRAGVGRVGVAKPAGHGIGDHAQAQVAGDAGFGILGQQLQGQASSRLSSRGCWASRTHSSGPIPAG